MTTLGTPFEGLGSSIQEALSVCPSKLTKPILFPKLTFPFVKAVIILLEAGLDVPDAQLNAVTEFTEKVLQLTKQVDTSC